MPTALDRIVDLRLRINPSPFVDVDMARLFLTQTYAPLVASAKAIQTFHRHGQITGLVLASEPMSSRFGVPEPSILVFCDPDVPETRVWAESCLRDMAAAMGEHCTVELNAVDRTLMEPLKPMGFGVAKLDLEGTVELALQRLRGHTVNPVDRRVEFSAAAVEQASAIAMLMRDFFLAHPQFGWGGPAPSDEAQAAIDQREEKQLVRRLAQDPPTDFVITGDGQLLGYFGFVYHPAHPLLGACAGINIILRSELQGMGLGKAAYLHMMERMHGLGVEVIYGRTSNPGVIHMGETMGRRLRRILLRRDGPFLNPSLIPPPH